MGLPSRIRWKAAGLWAAAGAGGLMLGVGAFMLSGLYDVAASTRHFAVTEWLVELALHRSVALYSSGAQAPNLDDPGLIRLGANHYELGCAPCHGSPAADRNPVVTAMYPPPPALEGVVPEWDDAELFWIVNHGIRMTGMPAWTGRGRDDEAWAVTAFIRRLPGMEASEYRALSGIGDRVAARPVSLEAGGPDALAACAACHGDAETAPISALVPALQRQKPEYLLRAMREYRADVRQSGIMEPVSAALTPDAAAGLVRQLADGRRQPRTGPPADPESFERGRAIAERGVPEAQIPPCAACHSPRSADTFPLLDGLSQAYLAAQLALFRNGVRTGTAYGAIMAAIAPRLSAEQVTDVTAYFAALPDGTAGGEARR